jgi:RNA polymerase sigma-70 factor (ECF subfamily)
VVTDESIYEAHRSTDPDEDVVALVQRGDVRAAFDRLARRHGDALYKYCLEALRDQALAEDVRQQVFIEAFRDLPHFYRRSTLRTWLFAIARHRVLDALMRRRNQVVRIAAANLAAIPDPRPTPDVAIDDARLRRALVECVGELEESVRTTLLLRFQEGFSYAEMAEILREREGTAQARVSRAMRTLRARIEAKLGLGSDSQSEPKGAPP